MYFPKAHIVPISNILKDILERFCNLQLGKIVSHKAAIFEQRYLKQINLHNTGTHCSCRMKFGKLMAALAPLLCCCYFSTTMLLGDMISREAGRIHKLNHDCPLQGAWARGKLVGKIASYSVKFAPFMLPPQILCTCIMPMNCMSVHHTWPTVYYNPLQLCDLCGSSCTAPSTLPHLYSTLTHAFPDLCSIFHITRLHPSQII